MSFTLHTANVNLFSNKIQLSGFSAYPNGSSSQFIRIGAVLLYIFCKRSLVTLVNTVTILRAERPWVAIPAQTKTCSVSQNVQTGPGTTSLLFSGHRPYFSGVKRQGRQAVHFHGLWKLSITGGLPLLRQYVFITTTGTVSHSLPFRLRITKARCTLLYSASSCRYYITISSFPRKQLNSHRAVGLLPHCQLT